MHLRGLHGHARERKERHDQARKTNSVWKAKDWQNEYCYQAQTAMIGVDQSGKAKVLKVWTWGPMN